MASFVRTGRHHLPPRRGGVHHGLQLRLADQYLSHRVRPSRPLPLVHPTDLGRSPDFPPDPIFSCRSGPSPLRLRRPHTCDPRNSRGGHVQSRIPPGPHPRLLAHLPQDEGGGHVRPRRVHLCVSPRSRPSFLSRSMLISRFLFLFLSFSFFGRRGQRAV